MGPKPALKKKRPPTSTTTTNNNAKEKVMKESVQHRARMQQLVFSWQEKIFSIPKVPSSLLRQAATILQPQTYDEIVEERAVQDWCGYPLCGNTPQKDQPRYHISLSRRKVFDQSELASFCSEACLQRSKYFRMQLSEDPVWIRDMQAVPKVHIILLDQDVKKVLANEQQKNNQTRHSGHEIRQNYVQQLLANVPAAAGGGEHTELRIVEHDDAIVMDSETPISGVHDAIEGYRIDVKRNNQQPTTIILQQQQQQPKQQPKQQEPITMDTKKDEETLLEDAMDTMMKLKDLKLDQPTEIERNAPQPPKPPSSSSSRRPSKQKVQPSPVEASSSSPASPNTNDTSSSTKEKVIKMVVPKPPVKKKKAQLPEMSLFGKIWTMTDRLTTKATRRYFDELRLTDTVDVREILIQEQQHGQNDESALMRGQIFSEKILETFSIIRAQIGFENKLEDDLIDLIQTFKFNDASMVVLDGSQAYMMTLVLFKALAELTIKDYDWHPGFEACCSAVGETSDTIDACVRVLKIAST
ncbi:hypothetical protein RO3G_09153 [Lichtheimia corymbifera JMRC:FSU:9682]|uniref:RNA polymerase II subunit B1 CTD phosphatase RPAP2 homolog n=1 Tax=Lichtheimia corymbifera JMRC:FSU:9682 TaxID=1263082 RepID=A0A068S226_9FUNG|nr:hypothetical protein RO3G_09153 [Lichtheimia corymbifera JMRC:FSU:9682]